jgi:transcriptional regulator GlxA family with amidase domain
MPKTSSATGQRGTVCLKHRRIIVVVVPLVDELDLVGPIQVFGAANRLVGKTVYEVEIVTNAKDLRVQDEGGLLSFAAQERFQQSSTYDFLTAPAAYAARRINHPNT